MPKRRKKTFYFELKASLSFALKIVLLQLLSLPSAAISWYFFLIYLNDPRFNFSQIEYEQIDKRIEREYIYSL